MSRYGRKSLEWVRRNRQPRDRTAKIGQLAGALLDRRVLSAASRLGKLQEIIARGTDEEFRNHCSLGGLHAGTLEILVDDPSRVRAVRDEWLARLLELLKRPGHKFGVSSIRFAQGRSHLTLEPPAGDQGPGAAGRGLNKPDEPR